MPFQTKVSTAFRNAAIRRYEAGEPLDVLSAKYDVTPSTIRRWVKDAGGTVRPVGRPKKTAA